MENEAKVATPDVGTHTEKPVKQSAHNPDKTVSQKLFSDLAGRNIPGIELALGETQKPPAPVAEPEVNLEPKPEVKPGPKYLSQEDFADALVKLKVDGVEEDAKFQDIIRRVQLDKHLTSKGQKLSEEEKRVREKEAALTEREKILAELFANQNQQKAEPEAESFVKDDPYVKRLEADLQATKRLMQEINEQTAPMRLNASLERVDKFAKESLGLNDFMEYRGKIQEKLVSLPPEVARGLDNESGWITLFKDIKLKELIDQVLASKKAPEPATKPVERTSPTIVPIESGRGSSKGFSDDESSKYRSLIEKAKRLTSENNPARHQAWEDVLSYQLKPT